MLGQTQSFDFVFNMRQYIVLLTDWGWAWMDPLGLKPYQPTPNIFNMCGTHRSVTWLTQKCILSSFWGLKLP